MKKVLYIILFISTSLLINEISFAESKDCSQYSTKTLAGLSDYVRCKKGLPPKKNFFESLKIKKTNPDELSRYWNRLPSIFPEFLIPIKFLRRFRLNVLK